MKIVKAVDSRKIGVKVVEYSMARLRLQLARRA